MAKIKHFWNTNQGKLLVLSIIFLAFASIFVGYKEAKINITNSDALSYNVMLSEPYSLNNYHAPADHANVIHFPFVSLENRLIDLTHNNIPHYAIAALLMLLMNMGIIYIVYKISDKNKNATAIAGFLLTSITLFTELQGHVWGFSSTAIRNIEIPLIIMAILMIAKSTKISHSLLWIFLGVLIGLTDMLAMYYVAIAIMLFIAFEAIRLKSIKRIFAKYKIILLSLISIPILAKIISLIINKAGILVLVDRSQGIRTTGSLSEMFNNLLTSIEGLMKLFGANVFNATVKSMVIYSLGFIVFAGIFYFVVKAATKYKKMNTEIKLIMMFGVAGIIFAVLFGVTDRYLVYIPAISIIIMAYELKSKIQLKDKLNNKNLILICIVALIGFIALVGCSNIFYNRAQPIASTKIGRYTSVDMSELMKDQNVGVVVGSYWVVNATKYHYDKTSDQKLIVVSCPDPINSRRVDYFNMSSSGMKKQIQDNDRKSAIVVGTTMFDELQTKEDVIEGLPYGKLVAEFSVDPYIVLIYDSDVRDKIDFTPIR